MEVSEITHHVLHIADPPRLFIKPTHLIVFIWPGGMGETLRLTLPQSALPSIITT